MVSEVWKRSACYFIEMSVEEREQFLLREGETFGFPSSPRKSVTL